MKSTVLLIDDDPVDIKPLQLLLESWDLDVVTVRSGEEGMARLADTAIDVVISDVRMPGMSGEDVVRDVSKDYAGVPVVLITGKGDIRSAVNAMKLGALDYILKPPDEEELRLTVQRAIEHAHLRRENRFLRAELAAGGMYGERLIGRSPRMLEVFDVINRVARTDSTVMITGETGTGKELVAQAIHFRSPRAEHPLVAVNCAALNANLIESELFGHERGAFTGAVAAKRGRFEDAEGGTLFLDEVSETSVEFQAKLLRVLQESTFERVGGNQPIRVDVRLLASTNRDLDEEVKAGKFREDLLYRLRVIPIRVPPLRERTGDIPVLAGHFLDEYKERYGGPASRISDAGMRCLESREWKGNVRELKHAIERAVVLARGDTLEPGDFELLKGDTATDGEDAVELREYLDVKTREHVLAVLERTDWRKKEAAELLGVDRATLYRMMKRFGLEKEGRKG